MISKKHLTSALGPGVAFAIALLFLSAGRLRATDSIGLFFDLEGTTTCLSDSFYVPIDAFLIAFDLSSASGISGWEARISADAQMNMLLMSFEGNGFNVRQSPEYQVGLPHPIPYSDQVLLAHFRLFPVAPGAVFIRNVSNPSIPGIQSALYASGADAGLLIPLACASSDTTQPVAVVSAEPCPQMDNVYLAPLDSVIFAEYKDAWPTSQLEARHSVVQDADEDPFLANMLASDVCVEGTVVSSGQKCLKDAKGNFLGAYVIRVRPATEYWGDRRDTYDFLIPRVSVRDCVLYESTPQGHHRLPSKDDFGIFAASYRHNSVLQCAEQSIVLIDTDADKLGSRSVYLSRLAQLKNVADTVSVASLLRSSTNVVVGTITGALGPINNPALFCYETIISHSLFGDLTGSVRINPFCLETPECRMSYTSLDVGSTYIMFLERTASGYALVMGRWGIMRYSDNMLVTAAGYPCSNRLHELSRALGQ